MKHTEREVSDAERRVCSFKQTETGDTEETEGEAGDTG